MLDDALVERFSRQILLAEVGGRGQERLCGTAVVVAGEDGAARFAAMLLARAGLRVSRRDGTVATVFVGFANGDAVIARSAASGGVIATLIGRPCPACFADEALVAASSAETTADAAAVQAMGALLAGEALRVALGLADAGRIQTIDLARGTFGARTLPPNEGCAACRDAARRRP